MFNQTTPPESTVAPNQGFDYITAFLQDNLKLSGLYCFGTRQTCKSNQCSLSGKSSNEQHTHYYLLAFCPEFKENAVGEVSDVLKTKSEGRYTITLLLHKATAVRQLTPHQSYFFHRVMQTGIKLYEHPVVPPAIAFEANPKRNVESIKAYWHNRNRIAQVFLESQNQIEGCDTQPIQESMMHLAIENTTLALIDTFLGYRPMHFSLGYLFDLCNLFCPLAEEIFPRNTPEEQKIFNLLSQHLSKLRFANLKPTDFLHTELLQRRCYLFLEKATLLIEAELKRLEETNQ
ncbi:hypothetical protein FLJC2902T_22590 [Flavobacterium limnosediminis JC2902]|uniref:HEPN domain-containing protein n=2 Tax=Flavobacterium TaxID=237 RepID=V6SKF1_9FLAO|nr:hypothetical protein FLJC2902T_22590 [Flavobacterium limnosediminis JC2902]